MKTSNTTWERCLECGNLVGLDPEGRLYWHRAPPVDSQVCPGSETTKQETFTARIERFKAHVAK